MCTYVAIKFAKEESDAEEVLEKVCVVRTRCGGAARKGLCSKNQVQRSHEKTFV